VNLKKRIVDNKIAAELDFEGSLDDMIRELNDLRDNLWRKGEWTRLRIEDIGVYDEVRFVLMGSRPETDAELRLRAGRAKAKATRTRNANR
jgi:hypothetical protein